MHAFCFIHMDYWVCTVYFSHKLRIINQKCAWLMYRLWIFKRLMSFSRVVFTDYKLQIARDCVFLEKHTIVFFSNYRCKRERKSYGFLWDGFSWWKYNGISSRRWFCLTHTDSCKLKREMGHTASARVITPSVSDITTAEREDPSSHIEINSCKRVEY